MSSPAGFNSRPMGRGRGRRGGENVEEVTAAMDKINNNVTDKVGEESAAAVWGAVQYGVPAEPVQESSALIDWDSLNANREENEKRNHPKKSFGKRDVDRGYTLALIQPDTMDEFSFEVK